MPGVDTVSKGVNECLGQELQSLIRGWCDTVPLYRGYETLLGDRGKDSGFSSWFRQLPLINKSHIRDGFPLNFVESESQLRDMQDEELIELEKTSGSTGTPIPLILGRGWWEIQEKRALILNEEVRKHFENNPALRRVSITSPACSNDICYTGVPSLSERTLDRSLYINLSKHPFVWTDTARKRMAAETQEWQPTFLDVDPVYGMLFARYCEQAGVKLPSLRFIISSYEYLSECHRSVMQRVFGVPIYNLYGSTETGHLMMEDSAGLMRQSVETACLELQEADKQGIGKLVVTTLDNHYMPLIRYDIGDLVRMRMLGEEHVYELHGRAQDTLLGVNGQRVTVRQVDQCFKAIPGICHYQMRQVLPGHYHLLMVPEKEPLSMQGVGELSRRLARVLGEKAQIIYGNTDYIPCEPSGKFRLCVNASAE